MSGISILSYAGEDVDQVTKENNTEVVLHVNVLVKGIEGESLKP